VGIESPANVLEILTRFFRSKALSMHVRGGSERYAGGEQEPCRGGGIDDQRDL
jgi:hypothetical protein